MTVRTMILSLFVQARRQAPKARKKSGSRRESNGVLQSTTEIHLMSSYIGASRSDRKVARNLGEAWPCKLKKVNIRFSRQHVAFDFFNRLILAPAERVNITWSSIVNASLLTHELGFFIILPVRFSCQDHFIRLPPALQKSRPPPSRRTQTCNLPSAYTFLMSTKKMRPLR